MRVKGLQNQFEQEARKRGFSRIAGIDEAGRGPLAGPVVAASVILPAIIDLDGIDDSKKLTDRRRKLLFPQICRTALSIGIGFVNSAVIDSINILEATRLAMKRAVSSLSPPPDFLLIDAVNLKDLAVPQQSIVKGDARSISIGAASILAKVARDLYMERMDSKYPLYNFAQHKGYPTKEHMEAIRTYGHCPIHRRSFHPKHLSPLPVFRQLSLFEKR